MPEGVFLVRKRQMKASETLDFFSQELVEIPAVRERLDKLIFFPDLVQKLRFFKVTHYRKTR